jgi:hypothetical protein
VSFLHHTSWQVDDIDDVGRGARPGQADILGHRRLRVAELGELDRGHVQDLIPAGTPHRVAAPVPGACHRTTVTRPRAGSKN